MFSASNCVAIRVLNAAFRTRVVKRVLVNPRVLDLSGESDSKMWPALRKKNSS